MISNIDITMTTLIIMTLLFGLVWGFVKGADDD